MLYTNPKCRACGHVFQPKVAVTNLDQSAPLFNYKHQCVPKEELVKKLIEKSIIDTNKTRPMAPFIQGDYKLGLGGIFATY